jgi:hypothetical protein
MIKMQFSVAPPALYNIILHNSKKFQTKKDKNVLTFASKLGRRAPEEVYSLPATHRLIENNLQGQKHLKTK